MKPIIYYHFTGSTLRDGKPIPPIGEWLVFDGTPVPCECGLHASPDALDALRYAPGNLLHKVQIGGKKVAHSNPVDKYAAQKRKIIATIDATGILRLFARRVALDVIHLWSAPPIVKEYLETGDESKRDAAWAAARSAAMVAAWDAAWAAAWAAARDAARSAAWAAARDAAWAAARSATRSATWDEKQKLYRGWFNEIVEAEFAMKEATQ